METIEPVLPFWTDRLDFRVTGEVREGDRLGFVIREPGGNIVGFAAFGSEGGG